MAFTALTGAVSHFAIGGAPDWTVFALCVVFTLLWARFLTVGFPLAFSSGGKPEAFVLFRFSLLFSGRNHCLFQTLRCIMS